MGSFKHSTIYFYFLQLTMYAASYLRIQLQHLFLFHYNFIIVMIYTKSKLVHHLIHIII